MLVVPTLRLPFRSRSARRSSRRLAAALCAVGAATVPALATTQSTAAAAGLTTLHISWAHGLNATHLSSPTVADINGDGVPDVLTADLAGSLHVLNGKTGTDLPGWPQKVQPTPGATAPVESAPTVADLDRNGSNEIIVSAGSLNGNQGRGGVVVFNRNGSVRWRMPSRFAHGAALPGVIGTPAVGDVNGDHFPDIVYGSWDHHIYALDRNGHDLPGFPMEAFDTIWSSPALYDTAHLGRMDIFIGGDSSPGGPCGAWSWAGVLRAIRVTATGPHVMWQRCNHQIFQSSAAIGDLEGNGHMALVIGTGTGPSGDANATNSLQAYHLDSGSVVPGWPRHLNGPIFGSPAIGDVSGDGKNDVVVTACAACSDGRVWAFHGNGTPMWNKIPGIPENWHGEIQSSPILVDLNGNGVNDVAVGMAGEFFLLRGTDGGRLYQPIEQHRIIQNSAAVANFGAGRGWRLVVQSWVPGPSGHVEDGSGRVTVYQLPKAPTRTPPWPQLRRSANHLGAPLAPPPAPAHSGYWLVASDGGIFTFGNAHYHGSTGAIHLNRPIVGMARTRSGRGYWMVASDGGIFAFGDARFHGSTGAIHLNRPIVGMTATPSGRGYWLVASDGGIFAFGDARFHGSTGGIRLNRSIVGMASTPTGRGYWLVASDGGMFSFGDAKFRGSTGSLRLVRPIVGMTPTPSGRGYWLVASDGGMFSFGDAKYHGSTGGAPLPAPVVGLARTPSGNGYWFAGSNGAIYGFGDGRYYGAVDGIGLQRPIVAIAASPKS